MVPHSPPEHLPPGPFPARIPPPDPALPAATQIIGNAKFETLALTERRGAQYHRPGSTPRTRYQMINKDMRVLSCCRLSLACRRLRRHGFAKDPDPLEARGLVRALPALAPVLLECAIGHYCIFALASQ